MIVVVEADGYPYFQSRYFDGTFISSQLDNESSTNRTLRPQPVVDWSTVHAWLEECNKEHDACDNGPLESASLELRLIDTERGCVVRAPPSCRYATLSYVWGSTTDTYALATTNTIQALEEEGYLFKKPLPATIRDSIRACIELKIRYLWIDRLCIVQDDTTAVKDSQINAMGDIYSHSYLTLVDLEGHSMDHGLPGVTQASPRVYQAPGMKLSVAENDFARFVETSKWNTRGWTFQEAMLSTRVLLFADVGVLFECSQASQESRSFRRSRPLILMFNPDQEYQSLVHNFTSRNLTFNADVLKAFSGIMHWKYGTEHYFGLPYCEFVKGMLWLPETGSTYETPVPRSAETSDVFPTWSWSSVMGPVRLPSQSFNSASLLGVWGVPSFQTKEIVHIIRPHSTQGDQVMLWNDRGIMLQGLGIALAWKEGCFPESLPPMLNVSTTWKDQEALIRSRWESPDKINEEALGVAHILGKEELERIFPSCYIEHANHPGALLAHTQSLRVRMVQDLKREWSYDLHSMCDDKVSVWIHPHPAHWRFLGHDYSMNHDTKLDVLALSMEHNIYVASQHHYESKQGLWYDSDGSALDGYNG
ncbi:hypothetical protein ABHI18_008234 [Aspergillus niger]